MHEDTDIFDTPMSGMKKKEWIRHLAKVSDEEGYFQSLGNTHCAAFIDRDPSVLLVTFETIAGAQTASEDGQPIGWQMLKSNDWSVLSLISDGDTWFRDRHIYAYFDRLVDDGFFEDFEKVIFYGAGPSGYAAASFSVAAPGATVIAVQPQATLDPRVAEWDDRFRPHRRISFTDRYGYAPDMLDAANHAFVFYDPEVMLDAMHAALFTRANVTKLRMRDMGDALQGDLIAMGLLPEIFDMAALGDFSDAEFAKLYRARRSHPAYLRNLMAKLTRDERDGLNILLCKNVVSRMNAPRFRRKLDQLLAAQDPEQTPPPPAIL